MLRHAKWGHQHRFSFTVLQAWLAGLPARACRFIHRPLGIAILIVVVIRFVNRQFSTLPPFPACMSSQERFVAPASEVLLYTLLFVLPLVGWGMLSAARYPIVLFGSLHLFPILPHSVMPYGKSRSG
jgi:cytochrome b561